MNKLTVATLYGGIGGGMLGFCFADYKPIWASDDRDFVDPTWFSRSWHDYMYSVGRHEEFPIFLSTQTVEGHGDFSDIPVPDVLVGSPQCKRFSLLAVRKKDRLDFNPQELEYVKFLKAVKVLQPKAFVLENLPSIEKHFEWAICSLNNTPVFSQVGSMDAILFLPGYEVHSFVLNSADLGVPQKRKRLYVIGIRNEFLEFNSFPEMKVLEPSNPRTVRDTFKDIENAPNMELPNHSQKRIEGFVALKPGQSYYGSANNRRLFWDKPSWTVTSHRTQMVHPSEPRTLTVRENAALMGFPNSFVFHGPRTKQLDAVGCGITPPVTYHIAMQLRPLLKTV